MIPIRRPASYSEAGVRVRLLPHRSGVSLDGLPGRDLTALIFDAAFAVRGGMKESDSLKAVTLEPARILRLAERLGSLEEGKDADLLIWSGHPLHCRSVVEKAWINGKLYFEREKAHLFKNSSLRLIFTGRIRIASQSLRRRIRPALLRPRRRRRLAA